MEPILTEVFEVVLAQTSVFQSAMSDRNDTLSLLLRHGDKIEDSRGTWIMASHDCEVQVAETLLDSGAQFKLTQKAEAYR